MVGPPGSAVGLAIEVDVLERPESPVSPSSFQSISPTHRAVDANHRLRAVGELQAVAEPLRPGSPASPSDHGAYQLVRNRPGTL